MKRESKLILLVIIVIVFHLNTLAHEVHDAWRKNTNGGKSWRNIQAGLLFGAVCIEKYFSNEWTFFRPLKKEISKIEVYPRWFLNWLSHSSKKEALRKRFSMNSPLTAALLSFTKRAVQKEQPARFYHLHVSSSWDLDQVDIKTCGNSQKSQEDAKSERNFFSWFGRIRMQVFLFDLIRQAWCRSL